MSDEESDTILRERILQKIEQQLRELREMLDAGSN